MDLKRTFFLNFEKLPVHDGDQWVGIAVGKQDLKRKYKKTIEELRNAHEDGHVDDKGYIYSGLKTEHLKVYEYIEERGFVPYPTENLLKEDWILQCMSWT